MKVNATQAAISSPATTALIANSRGTVRTRKGCIFTGFLIGNHNLATRLSELTERVVPEV